MLWEDRFRDDMSSGEYSFGLLLLRFPTSSGFTTSGLSSLIGGQLLTGLLVATFEDEVDFPKHDSKKLLISS